MDSDFKEDLEKRVSAVKIVLSKSFPFLFVLLNSFKYEISDRYTLPDGEEVMVPTAATDGFSTIIINPDFIQANNFDDSTLMGIVMHEILHILFNHTNRIRERQPFLWNVATDAAINYIITKIFKMSLPKGSIEGINNTAEKIYDELMQDYQPIVDKLRSLSSSQQGSQDTQSQNGSSSFGSQKQSQSGSSSAGEKQQQSQGQKQNQSGSSLTDKNQQQGEKQKRASSTNSQESGTTVNKQDNIQSGQRGKTANKTSSAKSNVSKQSIEEQAAKKTIEEAGIKGNNFDKHDLWRTVERVAASDPRMQEQIRQYREAIEEAIKSAFFGKMPDEWKILINEQTIQEPSFGWLDNFKKSLKTVSAPGNNPFSNRFRESSVDPNILRRIPSMQVMSNPVVIALDTSGSISKEELGVFVGYFLNAIKENGPRKINYIFITCDADIHSVISIGNTQRKNYMITFHDGEEKKEYLSPNNIQLDNLIQLILEEGIRGGGGTSFVPVFEYLKKESIKPAFVFYFTDCAGEYPEEPPEYEDNVYWMFYQKTKDATPYIRPPFGNLVYVSKDTLIAANKEENYENEL